MNKPREKFYQIEWKSSAVKKAKNFPKKIKEKIINKVQYLAPHPIEGQPLKGNLKGLRKLRIEEYRIIYVIDEENKKVIVIKIGSRGDVYK
ncbi:MAG: type II toxin-antitoxin system RelE/ParE family toxin [Candidatus Omnitrophica bacterium]|nr:type II toxin-antitoxin system RelE/ParE family toxin [Candidatus Omnitrophota bacterium]